jgi:hypothetical protein
MGRLTWVRIGKAALCLSACLLFMGIPLSPSAWPEDWQMTFTISVPDPNADGGLLVNRLEAGGHSTSTDFYDNDSDVIALPAGPVQAAFTHEGETAYPGNLQLLWRDIRDDRLPKSWKIKVVSQQSGSPVTVAWTAPPSISSDTCHLGDVSFEDQTTGQLIDLNAASTYSFDSTGNSGVPEIRLITLTVNRLPQNAPPPPSEVMIRSRKGSIQLGWTANRKIDLAGYNVWRSTSNGGEYVRLTSTPIRHNRYADQQTTAGMTYYYVVTALGGNSCESGFSQQTAATAR